MEAKVSSRKDLSVYFYKVCKAVVGEQKYNPLVPNELSNIFDAIGKLPIDINQDLSRYSNVETGEETCIALKHDNIGLRIPSFEEYLSGIFFKRRNTSYPYDDDGKGNIQQLKLSHDKNQIAEVTSFLVDHHTNILSWVNNRYVGRAIAFETYLNDKIRQVRCAGSFLNQMTINGENAEISFHQIIDPKAVEDFTSNMHKISTAELKIAGDLKTLEKLLHDSNSNTNETLKNVLALAEQGNAATVRLILSVEPERSKSIKKEPILHLLRQLKEFRQPRRDKLEVRGKIGEKSRTINLLSDIVAYRTSINYDGKYVPMQEVFKMIHQAYSTLKPQLVKFLDLQENHQLPY